MSAAFEEFYERSVRDYFRVGFRASVEAAWRAGRASMRADVMKRLRTMKDAEDARAAVEAMES